MSSEPVANKVIGYGIFFLNSNNSGSELFQNYYAVAQLVEQQLKTIPVLTLMSGQIDSKKLVSSLTLFHAAASFLFHQGDTSQDFLALASCCERTLAETAKQGYFPCTLTLNFLTSKK